MKFEWDAAKAAQNLEKHGVTFEEASTVFSDELSLTFPDPNSAGEARYLIFGASPENRLLVVVHVERSDIIRIISARRMTTNERRDYEQFR
jgi:uncharacterized DUF497 family protein